MKAGNYVKKNKNSNENFFQVQGKIISNSLVNNTFLVECIANKKVIVADIAARFRTAQGKKKARRKFLEGRKVIVEITLKDLKRGQIISLIDEQIDEQKYDE
ncbi:hypothetical protein [endosymbiont GvMRE of Glomus versiforme]|uniref:hypothetical protein n=1 Tax=endosymbiont GvMRE of Glomus versiforme TaxID=2039283 RepID=UPI000EE7C4F5|nr:hypothetical protein [endosymbiont GvMRE of Glomus versiforme]RHZ35467.1 Translation initiation factor IF-1 [endosymbiont GvMRE of Glomus versiforme]